MTANLPRPSINENVSSTLSSGINDSTTTITIADTSGIVAPCYLVIDRVDASGTLKSTSLWEYVKVTNVAGNDLTVTRAQGGSTAQSHSSGAVIEAVVTSSHFEDWYNALNPEHDSAGGHVIVGTMTVAGMNLSSVATIRAGSIGRLNVTSLASINILYVTSNLNASGASVVGSFTSDPFQIGGIAVQSLASIQRTHISDSLSFTSLASGPNIVRTSINSNLVIQKSTYSLASLGGSGGVNLGSGHFGAWSKTFATLLGAWGTIDKVTTGNSQLFLVDTLNLSSTSQPGTRLEAPGAGASSDVVITVYGIGTVNGGVA